MRQIIFITASSLKQMLTQEQAQFWDQNGYLILPGFFSKKQIDQVLKLQKKLWNNHHQIDDIVVDDLETNRRQYLKSVSATDKKKHRFKVNDLYLKYPEVRSLSLDRELIQILTQILPDSPVLCNTLTLQHGTEQYLHVDSLYMTPLTDNHLAATWIAMEDCHPDAGPLIYVPGSHKIPIYRFSTGSPHVVTQEFPLWQNYIEKQIQELGLKSEKFLPKKGDVFIWHSQLLHGGSAINNPQLTRESLVSHYFTKSDCVKLIDYKIQADSPDCYWLDRPHHQVPEMESDRTPSLNRSRMSRVEHILRTTLHYFRLWQKDVLNFPE